MITQSNDDAAQDLWTEVGMTAMQKFLDKAGMTHTRLNDAWGLTLLTPHDEMTLLKVLTYPGKVLSTASRDYALWLMSKVIPSQQWGVPAGAPSDVTVHVKNGWLPYPNLSLSASDWHVNSIGTFTGKGISYQIVVLTEPHGSQTESYGIATIQAAAEVINHDLAKV
jgi:beta-lactamase class A